MTNSLVDDPAPLVPRPAWARRAGPGVVLDDGLAVSADGTGAEQVADLLATELAAATKWAVRRPGPLAGGPGPGVCLRIVPGLVTPRASSGLASADLGDEGYVLTVSEQGVDIQARSPAGLFYGTRTLRQLMPAALLAPGPAVRCGPVAVEGGQIADSARFGWRGMQLDVARHFFPKDFVLKMLDVAAFHKFNVFHLHLTDDQGWRVPIGKYPLLTEVGAWRRESPLGHYREGRTDGIPHGGFYSRGDLAEIVAYAAQRFITVVPEIDMPGHMQAAIAAYPALGNTGQQLEVYTNWGISEHVLNVEDTTIGFCADVLNEIMDIFPGPFVHVGGDECPTIEWEESPQAQARASSLGLAGAGALQSWFMSQIAEVVSARGRTLVGWDEVLEAGAPPGSVIMVWRYDHALTAPVHAAEQGLRVVMAPEQWTYFDWAYSDDPREPLAIRPALSVEQAYSFEPVPPGLGSDLSALIMGGQCQLWSEYITSPGHAEYMYFPRACATAEALWSAGPRGWPDFEARLATHLDRLRAMGVNFRPLGGPGSK